MLNKSQDNLVIVDRDIKLFNYLYRFKVATIMQINRDVFGNKNVRNVSRRLFRLVQNGYLSAGMKEKDRSMFVYSLTPRSFRKYIKNCGMDVRNQIKSNWPYHDLKLVDIYSSFSKCKSVLKYFTENVIQSNATPGYDLSEFAELGSDAAIILKSEIKKETVAIEFENSSKSCSRYEEKLVDYYSSNKIRKVIYIFEEVSLGNAILQADKSEQLKNHSKVYYVRLSDVIKNPGIIQMKNKFGQSMVIQ